MTCLRDETFWQEKDYSAAPVSNSSDQFLWKYFTACDFVSLVLMNHSSEAPSSEMIRMPILAAPVDKSGMGTVPTVWLSFAFVLKAHKNKHATYFF